MTRTPTTHEARADVLALLISGDNMSHVPEVNLARYRRLKAIYDNLERAGDYLGSEFPEDANRAYALAGKYKALAQGLRA